MSEATHRPRSMLVTGGAGFIGSNFVRTALAADPELRLVNVDALTYAGHLASLGGVTEAHGSRHTFVRADIRDVDAMRMLFAEHDIDTVVHLAAESHVDRSIDGPIDFIDTNIRGTANLLEAARSAWRDREDVRFHHVSTDEVFGSLGSEGLFSESTPYDPSSPYSASKAAADHLVRAWHRTFGLPVTLSNCSNNYGPYQFPEKLVPLMILNALAGKKLPVYGKGANIRDWLHVEDHCCALNLVVHRGQPGRTYNIGGNNEKTNLEVVSLITSEPTSKWSAGCATSSMSYGLLQEARAAEGLWSSWPTGQAMTCAMPSMPTASRPSSAGSLPTTLTQV